MKAEERHHLKTNELAETLHDLPAFMKKHGNNIMLVVIAVLIVIVASSWIRKSMIAGELEKMARLNELVAAPANIQFLAAQQAATAQIPQEERAELPETPEPIAYNTTAIERRLGELAADAAGTSVEMMALLAQADLIRSALFFSDQVIPADEQQANAERANALYQQVLTKFSGNAQAVASARLGLALLAEDQRDWPEAAKQYESIIADAGTGVDTVLLAKSRKAALADLENVPELVITAPAETPTEN